MPEGPGDPAWGDPNVSCDTTSDCAPNEACVDNICQMARCTDGPYESQAPLAAEHYFYSDRELITVDRDSNQAAYWVDGYLPTGSTMTYPSGGGSWNLGTHTLVDVAGGNVLGKRPELFVVAVSGQSKVVVKKQSGTKDINLSFVPVAVATGDVDADGIDEIIAISAGGKVAMCDADIDDCKEFSFSGNVEGQDVGAGDIDGDGFAEPVFLVKADGNTEILAWNVDWELTQQEEIVGAGINTQYMALDVGDVDGDGTAEVFALEDGGWAGFAKDHVHVYRMGDPTTRLSSKDVDADSRDITVDDLNMDQKEELVVLRDTRTIEVYDGTPDNLGAIYTADLSVTNSPGRIAAADFDGNSPSARRTSAEPELVPGQVVPTIVLHWPPYSKTYSDGIPYLFVGDTELASEQFTDSVGVRAGISLGVGAEVPGGIFGAEITARMSQEVRKTQTQQVDKNVGTRFVILPDPELHGYEYSVVVLTTTCFHAYRYVLEDPDNMLGTNGDGSEFALVMPVGGAATVWSSNRYNSMAEAVGGLPIITQHVKLGDPSAYPTFPAKPDGTPLYPDDLLFKDTPTFLASDVAKVGWWLSASERETNEVAMYTDLSVSSNVKVAGVKFGSELGVNFGNSYGITVGKEAVFGGAVPAIPDDPDTPEDEYATHAFSFAPLVYREKYEDRDGNEASYYVLSFMAGQ